MLSKEAAGALMEWNPVSSRIITARFYTKVRKLLVMQYYAPTNDASKEETTVCHQQEEEM